MTKEEAIEKLNSMSYSEIINAVEEAGIKNKKPQEKRDMRSKICPIVKLLSKWTGNNWSLGIDCVSSIRPFIDYKVSDAVKQAARYFDKQVNLAKQDE